MSWSVSLPNPSRMQIDSVEILKVTDGARERQLDSVVREAEVVIRVDGRACQRLFCLPTDLEELAVGHLASRGTAIADVQVDWEVGRALVSARRLGRVRRNRATSQFKITEDRVFDLVRRLEDNCPLYRKTGGTHVVAVFQGSTAIFAEDVSRHCAIDKVIGASLMRGVRLSRGVLVTSCRQTQSAMKKVVHAQIPVVITISAPTNLAIRAAEESGVTLVGFVRGRQFNVYSHDWRILKTPA